MGRCRSPAAPAVWLIWSLARTDTLVEEQRAGCVQRYQLRGHVRWFDRRSPAQATAGMAQIQLEAMRHDFGWQRSAQEYMALYEQLCTSTGSTASEVEAAPGTVGRQATAYRSSI
jgi:hypothetical protein